MGACETYFAVIKSYCAINVLLLPKAFKNGGFVLSPAAMFVAVFFETLCAVRLSKVAHIQKVYSYPLLMEKALGVGGLQFARIVLALAHWEFCIGQMTFTLKSLQTTFAAWTGHEINMWYYGIAIFLLYSPLVWVRRLEPLSKLFIFAAMMILLGVLTTSVFAVRVIEEQGGHGEGYEPVNQDSFWGTIGFAFFMFEGIGCLLPVMKETEKPQQLPLITALALITLCIVYVSFSSICYYAWGASLTEPVVTEMLPADNLFVQIMKMLFCLNLVFSFPLTMVPAYSTIEVMIMGQRETSQE